MYGREPNDFTANIQLSEQDMLHLRLGISTQRKRLVDATFELLSPESFSDSKRVKLLEKLHRERMALDDMELAHTVAVKNSARFQDIQSDYREELEKLSWEDKEAIDRKTEELKEQNEEAFLLVRIRNMLADFMGMIEIRMRHQDRIKRYESGEGIAGSSVNHK